MPAVGADHQLPLGRFVPVRGAAPVSVLGDAAVAYALAGWEVLPLAPRSKVPAIPKAEGGRGVLDATADVERIRSWWARAPARNIGLRVPSGLFVLDVDSRHDGDENLRALIAANGDRWARTLTANTGGGGWHFVYTAPGGPIGQSRLPPGVEVKTHAGYVVVEPSVHPFGRRYEWCQPLAKIVAPIDWLADLLVPEAVSEPVAEPFRTTVSPRRWVSDGDSPADWFSRNRLWEDVLTGWEIPERGGDGEADGSKWRHPSATAPYSATICHGCLFVYSDNAGLPVTDANGTRNGLTKFRAYAHLNFGGDLSAAARAVRKQMALSEEVPERG